MTMTTLILIIAWLATALIVSTIAGRMIAWGSGEAIPHQHTMARRIRSSEATRHAEEQKNNQRRLRQWEIRYFMRHRRFPLMQHPKRAA